MKTIEHLAPVEPKSIPIYQASYIEGVWCDIDQQEYDHQKNIGLSCVRILYTSPPDVAELQKQLDHSEMAARQEARYADELRKQVYEKD
jgi:hypothetical protein